MAMRTQKQREQWETRCLLGDLTGLPQWIRSKVGNIDRSRGVMRAAIHPSTMQDINALSERLRYALKQAESEVRREMYRVARAKKEAKGQKK